MKMLRARLARVEEEKREAEQAAKYNQMPKVGFGSQIRSYFLHPEQRVKDSRTGHSDTSFHKVLDGDIQDSSTPICAPGRERVARSTREYRHVCLRGRGHPRIHSVNVAKSRQIVDFCHWVAA